MKIGRNRKWNNGDMSESRTNLRVTVANDELITAPATKAFELVCAEMTRPGGIFSVSLSRQFGLESLRHIVVNDLAGRRFDMLVVNGWRTVTRIRVAVEETAEGYSLVKSSLTITPLNEQGAKLFDSALSDRMATELAAVCCSAKQRTSLLDLEELADQGLPQPIADSRESKRVRHQIVIQRNPDDCFWLACPVAELKWIENWCFDLICSQSGQNEDDNVFLEPFTGFGVQLRPGANTYWYTTLFDKERRRFHAVLMTPESIVADLKIEFDDLGNGSSQARWELEYYVTDNQARELLSEPGFERRMHGMLDFLALSAKHYIETGKKYRVPKRRWLKVLVSMIRTSLRRHVKGRKECKALRGTAA